MKSDNYNDAYYRLGITQEERKNIFNGCVNRDKIAFDNNGISQIQEVRKKKNDLADRLTKMAICCVAIISVVVMAAYGTKLSKGSLRGVSRMFGGGDSNDYGEYTLEVISAYDNNSAKPKIGDQIDLWLVNESYDSVLSKFSEEKNSNQVYESIDKDHLGLANIVDVTEKEWDSSLIKMDNTLLRSVLFYECLTRTYNVSANIPISVECIKEHSYAKYEVTISLEKKKIKKIKENEKKYGKVVYDESSLLGVNLFPDIMESDEYTLFSGKSELTVAYWLGKDEKFDIKENDVVDLIVNNKDGEEKRFEDLKVIEVMLSTDRNSNPIYYVSFKVSKNVAEEVRKLDEEKTNHKIFSLEKK